MEVSMRMGTLVFIGLLVHAAGATAQDAQPPRGIERIVVQPTTGVEIEGELITLGPASISLFTTEGLRGVPLESVQRIQLKGDKLRNGALIGAAIGAAFYAPALRHAPEFALFIPFGMAAGAAIGAYVDSLIPGRTTIYSRPLGASMQQSGRWAGLSVKFGF
jgi:hypothetical protein